MIFFKHLGKCPSPGTEWPTLQSGPFDLQVLLLDRKCLNKAFLFVCFQTLAVLNPLQPADATIMQDTDLAGPLVFCLGFGGALMLVILKHFF